MPLQLLLRLSLCLTMASSTIQPTAFPRFDTLSADSRQVSSREDGAPEYRRRQYSYARDISAQPKGRNALLQSYSRFIASFTGESEVCFQFALRSSLRDSRPEIVQAAVIDRPRSGDGNSQNSSECTVDTAPSKSPDHDTFGFGLELLADPDHFSTISESPIIQAVCGLENCSNTSAHANVLAFYRTIPCI